MKHIANFTLYQPQKLLWYKTNRWTDDFYSC